MLYRLIEKTNIDKYVTGHLVLAADLVMVLLASLCSITFVGVVARNLYSLNYSLLWVGGSFAYALILFLIFKTHKNISLKTSFSVVSSMAKVVLLKQVLLGATIITMHFHAGFSFPHLVALLIVDGLSCLVLLIIAKMFAIVGLDVTRQRIQRRRATPTVMVYVGNKNNLAIEQHSYLGTQFHIVGYVTPGLHSANYQLGEACVYEYSSEEQFGEIIDYCAADALLFMDRAEMMAEENSLVRFCNAHKIKVLYNPPVEELTSVRDAVKQKAREVRIEDLLGRDEIKISVDAIKREFAGKVVMVTGAAGSIGSQLCRQLATYGIKQLILFDSAETPMHNIRLELEERFPELNLRPVIGDVRIERRLDFVFRTYRPQVVFHAAAYKHVPLMEENPCEAVLANVVGSRNVANKCIEYDAEKMVMISTDKAVNPTNIMGCTKRLAEIYVQSLGLAIEQGKKQARTKFVTTRFGNVLGSNGSVIPRFREQIAKGGPVTVTHPDITRFFMTIPEACRLVLEAATMTSGNEIFVFDMGKSVRIADMARKMIELAGLVPDKDIKIEYTGLRPGEKLYEEVLATAENTIPTDHSAIRIAKVRQYDYDEASAYVDRLEQLSRNIEIEEMVKLMKEIVTEFKSKNSVFEKFDK